MSWLSGWTYRKKITITGQSGAGTLYQVDLSIGHASGGDFHLENHCTSFPNDIQVTDNDGITPLDYWVEDLTVDPITMWIEVADDLGSNVDIYVYYGKSGESSGSNGTNTFEFFDDFEDDSIDTNKWDYDNRVGTWTESDGQLHATHSSVGYMYNKIAIPANHAIVTKTKSTAYMATPLATLVSASGDPLQTPRSFFAIDAEDNYLRIYHDSTHTSVAQTYSHNVWYISKIYIFGNDFTIKTYDADGVAIKENSATVSSKPTNDKLSYRPDTNTMDVEYIRVRKYASPEPPFSSAGSEEVEAILLTISEILKNLDENLSICTLTNFCSDSMRNSDAGNLYGTFTRNLTDIQKFSDSNLTQLTFLNQVQDNFLGKDALSSELIFLLHNSDILKYNDSASTIAAILMNCIDWLKNSDASRSILSLIIENSDIFKIQDISQFTTELIFQCSDILKNSEYNEIRILFSTSSLDIIKTTDTNKVQATLGLSGEDKIKGIDNIKAFIPFIVNVLDKISLSDLSFIPIDGIVKRIFIAQGKTLTLIAQGKTLTLIAQGKTLIFIAK